MTEATVESAWCVGIRAKYLGPTNHMGSRWRIWRADENYRDDPDAITVPYDYGAGTGTENAMVAIRAYLERKAARGHSWEGRWVVACGSVDGYVAVRVPG